MRVREEDVARLVEASRLAEAREEAEKQEQERRVREAEEQQRQAVLEKQAVTERHLEDQKASNLRLRKGASRLKWTLAFAALVAVVAVVAARWAAQQTANPTLASFPIWAGRQADLADAVVRGEVTANAAARQKGWRPPRIELRDPTVVAARIREHFSR